MPKTFAYLANGGLGRSGVRGASSESRTLRTDRRARYVGACWASVRARRDGQTGAVRRVDGRANRRWSEGHGVCGVGGRVGNGQATCGHDGRQACGRSGDSDGLGGYGRLGCGWRVCWRVRPPRALVRQGAGGLRENCRTLVSYAFGRPKFFCKRRALPCGNSCGMCVSLKKKYARPAYGRPAAPCRAGNAA